MSTHIDKIFERALDQAVPETWMVLDYTQLSKLKDVFARLIVQECIAELECYRIPVGNSAAGEMACEWTYDALLEIRDNIRSKFI